MAGAPTCSFALAPPCRWRSRDPELEVDRDGQSHVELPICVGSDDRLLASSGSTSGRKGFAAGTPVRVAARINHEKLLEITAEAEGRRVEARLLHPMTNAAVGTEDAAFLRARQDFNEALLERRGRPPLVIVKVYARAAETAGYHEIAADLFQKLERMEDGADHAVSISYNYACAGMTKLSARWKRIAWERNSRSPVAAYNLSLDVGSEEAIRLLRRAIELAGSYPTAERRLGMILIQTGRPQDGEAILGGLDGPSRTRTPLAHHRCGALHCP